MTFAAAAGHALTRDTTASVLEAGGTAVDAVIAGAFMAMAAEPVLAGLLGGGFLMLRSAGGETLLLDGFVDTPRKPRPASDLDFHAVDADFGPATQGFRIGTGTIATPGLVPMLAEAHERHGRVPLAELAAPAIGALRTGVTLTPFQASLAEIVKPILTATPSARALHCGTDGNLPGAGTPIANPRMADVLEVMGAEGPRFVTHGEIAQGLATLAAEGGHLTGDDLARYLPTTRRPFRWQRGPARLSLNPDPALGGLLIALILRETTENADPVALLLALGEANRLRAEAAQDDRPLAALFETPGTKGVPSTRGTTHISAIDRTGMGAALTLSNGEGCGHVIPGTGIMPNNMLGEADLLPGGWHDWTPGTRLASMMAPSVIDWPDGRFALLGSGGSNRIRSAMAQVILNLTDRKLPLEDAILAPRLHSEPGGEGPGIDIEDQFPPEAREALLKAHPKARIWPEPSMFFGGVHAVLREAKGTLRATGDPRRDGAATTG